MVSDCKSKIFKMGKERKWKVKTGRKKGRKTGRHAGRQAADRQTERSFVGLRIVCTVYTVDPHSFKLPDAPGVNYIYITNPFVKHTMNQSKSVHSFLFIRT